MVENTQQDKSESAKTRKDALSGDRRRLLSAMMEKEAAEKQAEDLQATGFQPPPSQADSGRTNPFAGPGAHPGPGQPPGTDPGQDTGQPPNFGGHWYQPGAGSPGYGNWPGGFNTPFGGAGTPPGMGPGMMPGMMSQMFGQPGMGQFGHPGQPFGSFNPMNFTGMGPGRAAGNTPGSSPGPETTAGKGEDTPPASPLVAIKASGSRPPFFCVHAILGSVFPYHNLALHMDKDQPFYGLQSTAVDGRNDTSDTIEAMASEYLSAVQEVQPKGPYYLGGYSFGGWVVYEMVRQLREAGDTTNLLAIFGTLAPPISNPCSEKIKYAMEYMADFNDFVLHSFMADHVRMNRGAFMENMMNAPYMSPAFRMYLSHIRSQIRYSAKPIPVEVDLFLTQELQEAFSFDLTMGWDILCAKVDIHRVSGNHISTFHDPHVRDLAKKLTGCLQKAQAGQA